VGAAQDLGVPLLGGPALAVGHDVVDLALCGAAIAEFVLALQVTYFDGSAGGSGEKP
jgi:hypothetical protein